MDGGTPGSAVRIRWSREEELPRLAEVFEAAVRGLGPLRYTPEQVEAWVGGGRDKGVGSFLLGPHTLVAERDGGVIGFASFSPDGHLASLYVHPDHGRAGIGGRLLRALLREAAARGIDDLHTEASEFSRPVFERAGFVLDEVEEVERDGVAFTRYRMVRSGHAGADPG